MFVIDDLDDPRVADYRDLRERDLLRRDRFIAEGEVVLKVLVRSRFRMRSLFVAHKHAAALAPLVPAGVPIYTASEATISAVAGFSIHRGVLASAEVGAPYDLDALVASARRTLVLEAITNHDNVGGIFRNAAAFGVDAVLFDGATCDPLYRKAIRVSVGGSLLVPFQRAASTEHILERLHRAGTRTIALTPARDALPLDEITVGERDALVLGTEGAGLSAATMSACSLRATIPMPTGFDSLNVATCSGIALYALSRRALTR